MNNGVFHWTSEQLVKRQNRCKAFYLHLRLGAKPLFLHSPNVMCRSEYPRSSDSPVLWWIRVESHGRVFALDAHKGRNSSSG